MRTITPYSSGSGRTSTTATSSKSNCTSAKTENALGQIHSYTHCPHTSPPANRPLNAQPLLDPATGVSTIAGRCPRCDQAFRRDSESAILATYLQKIKAIERQYAIFDEEDRKSTRLNSSHVSI